MRVILAFLAMEVALGIAPSLDAGVAAVLRTKLFMLAHLNQCAVDQKCSLDSSWRTSGRLRTAS